MEQVLNAQLQLYLKKVQECKLNANELLQQTTIPYEDIIRQQVSLRIYIEKLSQALEKYAQTSAAPSEEFIQHCIETQAAAEETQIRIEVLTQTQEKIKKVSQPTTATAVTRLPKLSLPNFSGNILEFTEFWDRFESSIGNQDLTDVDKLTYLIGCLSGAALDTVRGLQTTNDNYEIAVNTLQTRFGSKTLVRDAHFKALAELKRANDSAASCRSVLNALQKTLRILKNLGEDVNSNHIRVVIMSKFPERILYEVNVLNGIDSDADKTMRGLEHIITAMELSNGRTKEEMEGKTTSSTEALHIRTVRKRKHEWKEMNGPAKRWPPQNMTDIRRGAAPIRPEKRKHTFTATGMAKRIKQASYCVFCNGEHTSYLCKQVTKREDRKRILSTGARCFNCLGTGHYASSCRYYQTCAFCGGNHNRALCGKNGENENPSKITGIKTHTYNYNNTYSFLQTATVEIQTDGGNTKSRALLDSGSQRSYITTSLANRLNIKNEGEDQLLVYTFGSDKPKELSSSYTDIKLVTKRGIVRSIRVNIVPYITARIPVPNLPNLPLDIVADDNEVGESIDLLIGNDYYFSFMRNDIVRLDEKLYIINSDFGWIVSGNLERDQSTDNTLSVLTYCHCHEHDVYFGEPDLPLQNRDMKFLWSLESIGITDSPKTTVDEEAIKQFNETVEYKDGRYSVKWPWTQSPPDLPTNYGLAYGRLKGLLTRLDQDTLQEYHKIIKEQLEMNIIEEVESPENAYHQTTPPMHYLPHHMVKQEGKRGRIVYDASAKLKDQKGLNECMYRGPSLLQELTALILKFRTCKIGIVADVEKAFLQIGLQEHDRDVTRFLWLKDPNKPLSDNNLIHLRFCRVPFGIISSPFLLTASIRYHMAKTNPQLLSKIADKCYVDNLVTGATSKGEAYELYEETNKTFKELSMNIRDWNSNDKKFLEAIPKTQQAKETDVTKVLGLMWNLKRDTLQLKIKEDLLHQRKIEYTKDKREFLSIVASLYDPCGYVSPLILPSKLLFQEICNRKLKWDSELPDDLKEKWEKAAAKLRLAKQVEVPRFVGLPQDNNVKYQLHCFTDASKDSFAAVIYIRAYNGEQSKVSFLMSKSRVTPSKNKDNLQIPRLELLGYVIGSRLLKYVKNALELPIEKEYLWTDSQVVLSWIQSNKLLPPFVARRISEIEQNKSVESCYIDTTQNPADVATRPDLWPQKVNLWFYGPHFLSQGEGHWPSNRNFIGCHTLVAGESLDTDSPEEVQIAIDDLNEEQNWVLDEVDSAQNVQDQIQADNPSNCNQTTNDTQAIKMTQKEFFPEEVKGKVTHLSRNLGLFLDVDGVLRSKGRMANTDWTYDKKHPILIPKGSKLTTDIVRKIHETNYHVGVPHTLSLVRQQYWIPKGRAEVQRILRKCPQCIKHGGGPYQLPPTPALPMERVNYSSPFTYTGIDYFGPIYVDAGKGPEKRWICLMTCLAIRAIHMEVVQNLTAEECIMALRRFISIRGTPKLVVSDNALYFKLSSEVLNSEVCHSNQIKWRFIPSLAPWHGGFYERMVALVKHCMKRTLDKQLLNDSQLLTVVKEIEAVINTRPLTNVSSDMDDILRPADFLTLGRCLNLELSKNEEPHEETTLTRQNLLEGWRKGQTLLEQFKEMFINQYLVSLRERYQHALKQPRIKSHRAPQIGDFVQIKGDSKNRINWKVGKITHLIKGSDGQSRIARVQVGDSVYTRSIGHLYPLEVDESNEALGSENRGMSDTGRPLENNTVYHPPLNLPVEPINIDTETAHEGSQSLDKLSVEQVTDAIGQETVAPETSDEQMDTILPDIQEVQSEVRAETPAERQEGVTMEMTDSRPMRQAAIRARERIVQWTRNLATLL